MQPCLINACALPPGIRNYPVLPRRLLGGPAPLAATAHRWRYADTEPALMQGSWWDAQMRLGLCGDWLHGGKVEGAWLSGRALAQQVLKPA